MKVLADVAISIIIFTIMAVIAWRSNLRRVPFFMSVYLCLIGLAEAFGGDTRGAATCVVAALGFAILGVLRQRGAEAGHTG